MKKLILTFFLLIIYIYYSYFYNLPDNLFVVNSNNYGIAKLPFITFKEIDITSSSLKETSYLDIEFLNNISIKNIKLDRIDDVEVIPSGMISGLRLYVNGVLVVGKTDLENSNQEIVDVTENNQLLIGDIILKVNNKEVASIDDFKEMINQSNGEEIDLFIKRNDEYITKSIKPVYTSEYDYKMGLWVKDSATGVGTVSFYEPKSNAFAMLGHGISDSDIDTLIPVNHGELVNSKILYIDKSIKGKPGEIKSALLHQNVIGKVLLNTKFGIFGKITDINKANIDFNKKMKIAYRNEIEEGRAQIYCTLDNMNFDYYDIEIQKVFINNDYNNKSMQIKITDQRLLDRLGGIVRGLSGAPIIQNNKLVGVVTNVIVSDPTTGYGLFADIMIKQLKSID